MSHSGVPDEYRYISINIKLHYTVGQLDYIYMLKWYPTFTATAGTHVIPDPTADDAQDLGIV